MSTTTIDRRDFIRATVSASAAIAWGPRLFAQLPTRKSSAAYFDCHVHLTQPWFGATREPITVDHLLHWMDAHEIDKAAVLPLVSPESFWYPVTTEYVLRETQPHRDRLVPFCAIDPRTLATHLPTKKDIVDVLNRYRDAGARGFGEHKPMLQVDDPLSMRLYEACSEVKLPVLFHLDNFANMDSPGLPGLSKTLAAFPELAFIGHGKGWWASIAGGITHADLHVGYPKGPVAPGGAIDRLMDRHPNLYGDLSSSGAHAVLRDRKFGEQFLVRRSERLMFGTDYYDRTQTELSQFHLFDEFKLPPRVVDSISRRNTERILKIA